MHLIRDALSQEVVFQTSSDLATRHQLDSTLPFDLELVIARAINQLSRSSPTLQFSVSLWRIPVEVYHFTGLQLQNVGGLPSFAV